MICSAGAYLCLVQNQTGGLSVYKFLLFTFLFATTCSAYGYLINDLGDIEIDKKHGKRNTFVILGKNRALILTGSIAAAMILVGITFSNRLEFLTLWMITILASTFYSLPPLRLKERGAFGIVISVIAQSTLPILVSYAALSSGELLDFRDLLILVPFLLGSTVSGGALELAHQRHDLPRDKSTATSTLAVQASEQAIDKLYAMALWLDRIAVGVLVSASTAAAVLSTSSHTNILFGGGLALMLMYALAFVYVGVHFKSDQHIDPYYGPRNITHRFLHDLLPHVFVPTYLLVCLSFQSPVWIIAVVCFLVWRIILPQVS